MSSQFYNLVFATNVLRLLEERNLTKEKFALLAGVSSGFISELTNGKANPSLRIMEQLANALETPLASLLETTDLDKNSLAELKGQGITLPEGYELVSVILPAQKAFIVKKWAEDALNKINKCS